MYMDYNDITLMMEIIESIIYKNNSISTEYYYNKFNPNNITLNYLIKDCNFNKTPFLT